jgi:hypothetical protein
MKSEKKKEMFKSPVGWKGSTVAIQTHMEQQWAQWRQTHGLLQKLAIL